MDNGRRCRRAALLVLLFAASGGLALAGIQPFDLRAEYAAEPLSLDTTAPRLSWQLKSTERDRRGQRQTAYQVLAASSPDRLAAGDADLWDSGVVASDATTQVVYGGAPLTRRQRCYWKVRVWDERDLPSEWSDTASFRIGLLDADDWNASWIVMPGRNAEVAYDHNGFHTVLESSPNILKWAYIDLGAIETIDAVRLWPAHPLDSPVPFEPGFLFPLRYRIDVAESPDFSGHQVVVDRTTADQPNPGADPVLHSFAPVSGRYVRIWVTKLRPRNYVGGYGFALAEFEVIGGGTTHSERKAVTALDSLDEGYWHHSYLADGYYTSTWATPIIPPLFRRQFSVDGAHERAVLHIAGLGIHEARINGQRLAPDDFPLQWTDYSQRIEYQTYDVTDLLVGGENAIGITLGAGWFNGRSPGWIGGSRMYAQKPQVIAELELDFGGGDKVFIGTDDTWRTVNDGPVRQGELYNGETRDFRLRKPGWAESGYDDSDWATAEVIGPADDRLTPQLPEAVSVTEERSALSRSEPSAGTFIYDFGQNLVGRVRMTAEGPAGTEVRLRHGEALYGNGELYTENLTSALQTDRFILAGTREEVLEPTFTFHGFRYLEVTGLTDPPPPEEVVARVSHTAAPFVSSFSSSNPMIDKLMENIRWTLRGNFTGLPSDCPQRAERLGWMGDGMATAPIAMFNMDLARFYTKWIRDIRDAQYGFGQFTDYSPRTGSTAGNGTAAWGDAGVVVPWRVYQHYGDLRLLENHYPAARLWVDWIHSENPDGVWDTSMGSEYGDWVNGDTVRLPGWPTEGAAPPIELFSTAFYARSTALVAEMADRLGYADDAATYRSRAATIRDAFTSRFVADDGTMTGDTQSGYALALAFDLVPQDRRPELLSHLKRRLADYGTQVSTGIHASRPLMEALVAEEEIELAYHLLELTEIPSWLGMIDDGATTVWERWDGYVEERGFYDPVMNSFNHPAFGAIGAFIWHHLVGLQPDDTGPGFRRFVVRPRPGGTLTWVEGRYDSFHGTIAARWEELPGRLELRVTVPVNTSGTVWVPAATAEAVSESGRPAADAPGVTFLRMEGDAAVYEAESGKYVFSACDPDGPAWGAPPDVGSLDVTGSNPTTVSWSSVARADRYDVLRSRLIALAPGEYGTCQNHRDPDTSDTTFVEEESPAAGSGYSYLVRGVNLACGQRSSYGTTSDGTERIPPADADCP
jgi:alpha-L-rhamnosidase